MNKAFILNEELTNCIKAGYLPAEKVVEFLKERGFSSKSENENSLSDMYDNDTKLYIKSAVIDNENNALIISF